MSKLTAAQPKAAAIPPHPAATLNPTLRARLHAQLDPRRRHLGLSPVNRALIVAILLSLAAMVQETEPSVSQGYEALFRSAELLFGSLFAVEYVARLWAAAEDDGRGGGWPARLRWAISPEALIDLAAVAPMLLLTGVAPTSLLRLLRLSRILRLAKLGRLSQAWALIAEAVGARRYELLLSLYAALAAMITSASLLYLIEGPGQPDKFGSIPRALWWSVVTLTTIGYGDVYPLTLAGKVVTGATALVGIGLIAAPTGILAAAFSDVLQRRRAHDLASKSERS